MVVWHVTHFNSFFFPIAAVLEESKEGRGEMRCCAMQFLLSDELQNTTVLEPRARLR